MAAVLWAVLAFLVWNVRFDIGVRRSATRYLVARAAYLQGKGHRVEMAPAMRDGVAESARAAALIATPVLIVPMALLIYGGPPSHRKRGETTEDC